MIITEEQKKEFEQLVPEHGEALVAYGADLYRRGAITGVLMDLHKHRNIKKRRTERSPNKGSSSFLRRA